MKTTVKEMKAKEAIKAEKTIVKRVDVEKVQTNGKIYNATFNEQELNVLVQILNIAVKTVGLEGSVDQNARYFINKINAGEVK